MLATFIIDDEHAPIEILKSYIQKTPFLKLVGSTNNPMDAIQLLQNQQVDLVFLDVNMPYITGIDFMKLMSGRFEIILTTASPDHAVEGFEQNALDYLLKPFSFERFLKAAQKAFNQTAAPQVGKTSLPAVQSEEEYIWVKTENKGKMTKVNLDEIMYVEGLKNYLSIYTLNDRVITLMNIKDLEDYLPKNKFMRIHKSYIISMHWIRGIDCNQIFLKDLKASVPLGETYRTVFFNSLEQFMVSKNKGQ